MGYESNADVVYAYQKSVDSGYWTVVETLSTPDGDGGGFGTYITMDGTTAIISANSYSYIYSFVSATWNYQNPIFMNRMFGMSLFGTKLLVLVQEYFIGQYVVTYPSSVQLVPTALPTVSISPIVVPSISGAPTMHTRRPSPSAPTVYPTQLPTQATLYAVTLVQVCVILHILVY